MAQINVRRACGVHTVDSSYAVWRFPKKTLLNVKYGFWFSLQSLSETFLIINRIIQRDTIKMYFGLYVKCPLFASDFNETWIFWTDFRKMPKYQMSWKYVHWEPSFILRRTDRQTDRQSDGRRNMTKLTVAFRSFANGPKKVAFR